MMRQKLDPESLLYKDLFGIGACTVGSKAPASPPEPYDLTPPRMQPPGVPPSQAAPGTNHRKDEVPGYSVAPTCLGGYGDGPHVEITQHLGRDYIYRPRDPVLVALLDEAEALEDQQAQQAKKARKALPAYKSHQSKENVNRPALQTSTQTHSDPIPTPRSNEATFSGDATTTQDSRSIYTDPLYQPSTSQAVSRTQLLRSAVRSQARERLEAREGKGNGKGVGGGISKRSHRKH